MLKLLLNTQDDIYKNIEEYNLGKEHYIQQVFNDMIPDMPSNKNLKYYLNYL